MAAEWAQPSERLAEEHYRSSPFGGLSTWQQGNQKADREIDGSRNLDVIQDGSQWWPLPPE